MGSVKSLLVTSAPCIETCQEATTCPVCWYALCPAHGDEDTFVECADLNSKVHTVCHEECNSPACDSQEEPDRYAMMSAFTSTERATS
jgi:hypothetical protein